MCILHYGFDISYRYIYCTSFYIYIYDQILDRKAIEYRNFLLNYNIKSIVALAWLLDSIYVVMTLSLSFFCYLLLYRLSLFFSLSLHFFCRIASLCIALNVLTLVSESMIGIRISLYRSSKNKAFNIWALWHFIFSQIYVSRHDDSCLNSWWYQYMCLSIHI